MTGAKLTHFTNLSRKRIWSEEECQIMMQAALAKLIDEAGGRITIPTSELFKSVNAAKADGRILAIAMSDDDSELSLGWFQGDKA